MGTAVVRSLHVRPHKSADLAFNTSGVLKWQNPSLARLGVAVESFDETSYFNSLKNSLPDGRLSIDISAMRATLGNVSLFTLRNDLAQREAEQAVLQRNAAHLEWFKHKQSIIGAIRAAHSPDDSIARINLLQLLDRNSQEMYDELDKAYASDPDYARVLKDSASVTNMKMSGLAIYNENIKTWEGEEYKKDKVLYTAGGHKSIPQKWVDGQGWKEIQSTNPDFEFQKSETKTRREEFHYPSKENAMRRLRTQIDVQQEKLNETIFVQQLKEMETIWDAQSRDSDCEAEKALIEFANTFLYPPLNGIVTAIYKDIGESVQAGEPVIRIEDNKFIYLVGRINYRGGLKVSPTDEKVSLSTDDVFEDGNALEMKGRVAAIRGHDADNDEWDVIIECRNLHQLPINYHFDRDNTRITILN